MKPAVFVRALGVTAVLTLTPVCGAFATESGAGGWSITPYIWASDTKVDLALGGAGIGGGDVSFNDLMDSFNDLMDVLDAAFMIHVEGGKGHWSLFGDMTYLETSDTTVGQVLTVDEDHKQLFFDAAVAWWPLYGGLRFSGSDDRYEVRLAADDTPLGVRDSTRDYYDALVGVRYRFDFSPRWGLLTQADTSFGDSEGTYLLRANLAWTVGKRQQNRILFGYQYKEAKFQDGDIRADYIYKGPMAGFNFRF